jgi:hypothetical protein
MSQAGSLNNSGSSSANVQTLTGNTGGPVPPTANNINVVGSGSITVTGNPGTSTLTISSSAVSGIATINGDTGSVTGSTIKIACNPTGNGGTAKFTGSGTTLTFTATDSNNNTGFGLSSLTNGVPGTFNSAFGGGALSACSTATNSTAIGFVSLNSSHSDNDNTAIGFGSLIDLNGGNQNNALGSRSLQLLQTGSNNIGIGYEAGNNYSGSESSNIAIGSIGVTSESNVIRIGTQGAGAGQQNTCYVAGITGATVTGATVLCSTSGQLGTISSSVRFKDDIKSITSTDNLLQLNPVSFTYNSEKEKVTHYGLIAEEVEKVFPELVVHGLDGLPESVKYHEMPALLLAEIQKLRQEVNELKQRLA